MDKPNFIFILIDDMGWKDLACYGSPFYETPNIDAIAAGGMSFTDAYAACPVCSPTRASLHTGKYPARVGVTNFIGGDARGRVIDAPYLRYMPLEEQTIAKTLKSAGYNTWHVGKWHLGPEQYWPEHQGFDVNVAGCSWGMPANGYFSPYDNPRMENGPEGEYLTDRLTDEAVKLIRNNDGKPFFLNMAYYSVHVPIQAKQEYIDLFDKKMHDMGLHEKKTFEEGDHFPCDHKKDQRVIRRLLQSDPAYAAMIMSLDENIGRLMDCLRAEGVADNTIVMFTSDNGGLATAEGSPTCNAPLSDGKGWMYEGGTREPFIVNWPGVVEAGSSCSTPISTPDVYPTMLQMAGLDLLPEQHVDGTSFVPLLTGEGEFNRPPLFWHYPHYGNQGGTPGCSMRKGDYKLIEFFEDGRLELYNLAEDISESNDLAAENPQLRDELHAELVAWRDSVNALIPEPNPEWE